MEGDVDDKIEEIILRNVIDRGKGKSNSYMARVTR